MDDFAARAELAVARSRLAARKGNTTGAITMITDGLKLLRTDEWLDLRAGLHAALAEVLAMAGDLERSMDELARALALYEQKGNLVSAAKISRRRRKLEGQSARASE